MGTHIKIFWIYSAIVLCLLFSTNAATSKAASGALPAFPIQSTATLTSIVVSPSNPTVGAGGTQAFTALGTYSDGSTADVTASATWTSSNTSTATIASSGVATGVAAGSNSTITATLGSVSGSTLLSVMTGIVTHIDFNYANRTALLNGGWSFVATTAAGASRNTEVSSGALTVSYDQTIHPGTIRIPLGPGEDYGTSNNSQNTLFRGLPANWTSVRLRVASFNPTANYQQVGLMIYQNDDNYLYFDRPFANQPVIESIKEIKASDSNLKRVALSNTSNLIMRIDRNASTNTYTLFWSTDGGNTWTQLVATQWTLSAAQLGIETGTNINGANITADFSWVEIVQPAAFPAPTLTSISPNTVTQGQSNVSITLSGTNFLTSPTCNFGAGITVNSCTYNSSTQITANISVGVSAALGTNNVTVTNTDSQSATLASALAIQAAVANPAPTLASSAPSAGTQAQSNLNVVLTGTNFLPNPICSFGTGITVNSCTYNSATQITANISIASTAAAGASNISIQDTDGQVATLASGFTVNPSTSFINHIDFTYPDRTSLLAAGWSFLATTASGATRNTEVTSGSPSVDYNQTAHPGNVREQLGSGEMYGTSNNSQNTLFYPLPTNWTSIRLKIAAFNPAANYQQTGFLLYQDDDNYLDTDRGFSSGAIIETFTEKAAAVSYINRLALSNTGNLIIRIDQTAANNFTSYYSVDNGNTWTTIGSATMTLNNPKLAIEPGSDQTGAFPTVDLAWVEIWSPTPPPALNSIALTPTNPSVVAGTTLAFTATGTYADGTSKNITPAVTWNSSNTSSATINTGGIATGVTGGTSTTITATSGTVTGTATLTVTVPPPPPTLTSISVTPTSTTIFIGATQQFTATGNFSDGSTQNLTSTATWSSTNTAAATINTRGLASGIAQGSSTITATSGTISSTASLSVAPLPISVAVTPTTQSVVTNATQTLSANVQNDPNNMGVTWSLSGSGCTGATCGGLSSTTPTNVTYTAPGTIPTPATVTITATSVSDSTKSALATITIVLPTPITVALSPTQETVPASGNRLFTATLTSDTNNQGVVWSLSGVGCSGSACGTLTSSQSQNNTIVYAAPATPPVPGTLTLTATAAADNTKTASATITVSASALPTALGWTQLPNTWLSPVCPQIAAIQGTIGCEGVISAWSGGLPDLARNRLLFIGGGHENYWGNEVYSLNLNNQTLTRINEPTLPISGGCIEQQGTPPAPTARETYSGLAYVAHLDKIWMFGGALATSGCRSNGMWMLDLPTMTWKQQDPTNGVQITSLTAYTDINYSDYDAVTKKVFFYVANAEIFASYTPDTNTLTPLLVEGSWGVPGYSTGIIDQANRVFVIMGAGFAGSFDLNTGAFKNFSSQTTGCGPLQSGNYPGLAYDTVQNKIVGWAGGNTVYVFDTPSLTCTAVTYPGGPPAQQTNGTYGRWRYFPSLGVFGLVNDWKQNTFVLRLTPAPLK